MQIVVHFISLVLYHDLGFYSLIYNILSSLFLDSKQ